MVGQLQGSWVGGKVGRAIHVPSVAAAGVTHSRINVLPSPPSLPACAPRGSEPENKYETLEKYGKDLTEMARQGKLDPVIGRDDEIRRCIQILSRRTKNNPVLIGEPGVGKTAISEG